MQALFVVDPRLWGVSGPVRGPQLVAHLRALDQSLQRRGGRLTVLNGDPSVIVPRVARTTDAVYWNDDYTPYARKRDQAVASAVAIETRRYHGTVVHAPGSVLTNAGEAYRVFTPFWKKWRTLEWQHSSSMPGTSIVGDEGDGIPDAAPPLLDGGEDAATERLAEFLARADDYEQLRDIPASDGTSKLSMDLKFGTISPRRIVSECGAQTDRRLAFVRQICWRDFHTQILYHFPHTRHRGLRPEFDSMQWNDDHESFDAWRMGLTGYPLVDAGMRQLNQEGWMHNRVRMVTASFLVKDLLIDWRMGERHFRRHLLDGDLAQNVGNWQWVAGTGADAAPYFRIFNPVTQAKKFDPDGKYVRRYVPELAGLTAPAIHEPWSYPLELAAAGVTPGVDYPSPIVDHAEARLETLAAYENARQGSMSSG